MGFKADDDFLRFLTMGAVGCSAIAQNLTRAHGHNTVELERYTMSNKLWTTKVKRLRLPDLMCLACGVRIEARAKSRLEIKLSDSGVPGREWDAGLRGQDIVAFIKCFREGDVITPAATPQYFMIGDLRESHEWSRLGPPKSAADGSERDRTWPARVPNYPGNVLSASSEQVVAQMESGRRQTFRRTDGSSYPYVTAGHRFVAEAEFLLGTVAPPGDISCVGKTWNVASDLGASDPISRYSAVKAAGLAELDGAVERLRAIALDRDEDRRIALEAYGSLARLNPTQWTGQLADIGRNAADRALAMEAIFILTEVNTDESSAMLQELARDKTLQSEERAAAVWGLGLTGSDRPALLAEFVADEEDLVALHAVVGLSSLPPEAIDQMKRALQGDDRNAATAASLLSREGAAGARALADVAGTGTHGKDWALYGLGLMDGGLVLREAGDLLSPEAVKGLDPVWLGRGRSWLAGEAGDQLRFLQKQLVRPNSVNPAEDGTDRPREEGGPATEDGVT